MKRSFFLALCLVMAMFVLAPAGVALAAATPTPCAQDSSGKCPSGPIVKVDSCVKIALPFIGTNKCIANSGSNGGAIVGYLKTVLQVLSALVGTVIVLMLIIAGIQYMTSYGDPGNIKNAKTRIINAITALVLFLMMYAILSFLIPGGIFS